MTNTTKRPNILWITTDRQRHDTLGCFGNPFVTTPHLDALAANGVLFEQAWCQNPICGPSRASFLTGRYPRTTRLSRNGQRLPADEKLISRLLADAGYVCGHAGKYHLAPSSPPIADWCEPRGNDGYSVFDWSMHPPDQPVSQYTAWLVEHGVEFKRQPIDGCKYVTFGMDEKTSNTAWIAQRAINFLTVSRQLDRPWFFTMNIEDPHNPFDPPRRFLEPYLDRLDAIPLPRYTPGELDNKPAYQANDRAGVWGGGGGNFAYQAMTDRDHRLIKAAYWAMIDHIDYQVGRVIDALRVTGQLDNTLILFMSDHGEMLGDHGFYFQGAYFYEPMMHVPLLMHLPGQVQAGVRSSALVELVDIAPTLMQAAGLAPHPGMQGRSLWNLLTGHAPTDHFRSDVYYEYYRAIPNGYRRLADQRTPGMATHPFVPGSNMSDVGGGYTTGLRTAEYAISVAHDLDAGELYDLKQDPGEVCNHWDNPAYLPVKAQMLKRLCDRMAGTIDPLPVCEAAY